MRSPATAASSRPLVLAAACCGRPAPSAPRAPAPARAWSASAPAPAPGHGRRPAGNGLLRAGIVSVRVTGQDWNWRAPWEKQAPWTRTVTGLVVPGRRILVASTAFGNHLLVEAQKLGCEARTVARVRLVDHEGPLALVEVDDPAFWEGLEPLPLATAPGRGRGDDPSLAALGAARHRTRARVRQVRAGRHGLSQTSLLTLEVATSAEGLGESEVVVANGGAWPAS